MVGLKPMGGDDDNGQLVFDLKNPVFVKDMVVTCEFDLKDPGIRIDGQGHEIDDSQFKKDKDGNFVKDEQGNFLDVNGQKLETLLMPARLNMSLTENYDDLHPDYKKYFG